GDLYRGPFRMGVGCQGPRDRQLQRRRRAQPGANRDAAGDLALETSLRLNELAHTLDIARPALDVFGRQVDGVGLLARSQHDAVVIAAAEGQAQLQVDSGRQHEAAVVVGVLANQVHPARRPHGEDVGRLHRHDKIVRSWSLRSSYTSFRRWTCASWLMARSWRPSAPRSRNRPRSARRAPPWPRPSASWRAPARSCAPPSRRWSPSRPRSRLSIPSCTAAPSARRASWRPSKPRKAAWLAVSASSKTVSWS